MSLKLDALLQTRPKSAAGGADFRIHSPPESFKAATDSATSAAMFFGAVASTGETSPPIWFPEGFRLGAKFGSLRGLDWGPNLVP